MKVHLKEILITILIFIITIALIFALVLITRQNRDIVCNNIHLKVSDYDKFKFISEEDVHKHLMNSDLFPIGKLHTEIDLTAMEEKLMELKMVNSVICSFANNGDINVSVTQRVPMFRVKNLKEDYYIDNNRKKMPTSLKFSAYVPIVTGTIDYDFATTELYDFIKYLQTKRRWSSDFTQIYIKPNNEVELIPRVGQFIIKLGTLERYESKLDKLDKFLEEYPKHFSWDKYSVINLEYKDQVVCTKRNK